MNDLNVLADHRSQNFFAFRAWIFIIQLFFILMLVLPTAFQTQRGIFLVLITAVAGIIALKKWHINRDIILIWLATTLTGLWGIIWGLINDTPGALKVSTVYLIWPALYLLFIGLTHELRVIEAIESALLLGIGIATAMALIVMFAGILGYGAIVYPLLEFQDAGFGHYGGFIEYRLYSLTTVMYGFTFVLSFIIVRRKELLGLKKIGVFLLLSSIVLAAFGSGRRAFWLVMLVAPVIILFFVQLSVWRFKSVELLSLLLKSSITAMLLVLLVFMILGLDPIALTENFIAAFMGQEASSGARFLQAAALWDKFTESPLLGHGFGSTVDVVRSSETPWAYELSYLALLMNIGILGFVVYAAALFWTLIKGVKLSRKDPGFAKLFVPFGSALCVFLVMNATNPYLGKFDYLWVIFLPVVLINAYLTQRSKYD